MARAEYENGVGLWAWRPSVARLPHSKPPLLPRSISTVGPKSSIVARAINKGGRRHGGGGEAGEGG